MTCIFILACAEEPDPGDDVANGDTGGSSSSSDFNKENSRPSSASPSPTKPLSRRQRKNRRREEGSSPENKKKTKGRKVHTPPSLPANLIVVSWTPEKSEKSISKKPSSIALYDKLSSLSDVKLNRFFRTYLLSPELMLAWGYPVECANHPGAAIIFKSPGPSYHTGTCRVKTESKSGFDVNAREFVPSIYRKTAAEVIRTEVSDNSSSSGQDSGNSSDSGENDPEEFGGDASVTNQSKQAYEKFDNTSYARPDFITSIVERICVRCSKMFYLNSDNAFTYLIEEACSYHWGKLTRIVGETYNSCSISNEYSCCRGKHNSPGCTKVKAHVWNGLVTGYNGPFYNFVRTKCRKTAPTSDIGVYGVDCEMCYTANGLEVGKVTVVAVDGRLIYDVYVKPEGEVIDFNTRFSGLTAKDMQRKRQLKTLREVQCDLMGFIYADTILIGHGLENDLRALRIIHPTVIDTAVSFPHYNGLPYRRSLKSLVSCFLKREIQTSEHGHDSYEDAKACMELMLWRVRKDFRSIIDHSLHYV